MARVLCACEESQVICKEFRRLGHEAYSCDIQPCSGGHPEWHIQCDVRQILNMHWDLIIAHPPCTYLSNAGACRLYPKAGQIDEERYQKGLEAREFFMMFYNHPCKHICIENPIPSKVFKLPVKTQVVQPYEYGEPWSKKTYLWLRGLPELKPTEVLTDYKPYISCGTSKNKGNREKSGFSRRGGSQKMRSKTFPGIARAIAEQWGELLD